MKNDTAVMESPSGLTAKTAMDRPELSLLLYLESCATDYGGRVNHKHLNTEDFIIVRRWTKQGFIRFGRIKFADVNRQGAHWVELSEDAISAAHAERRARLDHMLKTRRYRRSGESVAPGKDPR